MGIKQTGALQNLTDQSFTEQELEFNFNEETTKPITAMVIQKNEYSPGILEPGNKNASKLNGNTKVKLTLEDKEGNPKPIICPV